MTRWTRIRCIPIAAADGSLAAWLGTLTDIDDERRAADRLRVAAAAHAALAHAGGLEATLDTLVRIIVPELADWSMINLLEADGSLRVAKVLHREARCAAAAAAVLHATMRPHGGGNAEAVRWAEPAVYPQLDFARVAKQMRENGLPAHTIDAFETLGFRSAVFVPLVVRGRPIGVLQAVRAASDGDAYDGRDVPAFADVAAAAATAIDNAQIFEALLDSERHLAVVSRASDELARSLSLTDTYATFVRIVVPDLADWAAITVRDPGGGLRTVASAHADDARTAAAEALVGPYRGDPAALGGAAGVIRSGRPEVVTLLDDALLEQPPAGVDARAVRALGLRSTVTVPLVVDGEPFGVIAVGSTSEGRLFTADDLPLFEELARRASAAIANARRFEHEHRVATALQADALPKTLPDAFGYAFSGHYTPGRSELQIGGDWYDALRLADGRIVLSIGDVLGTGLDAAVTMSNLRQVIRGVAQVHPDPALMLDAADKTLRADRGDRIVTALVGVLDPVTATLTYASAGHPPALLRAADGTVRELRTTGLPLGLRERDESVTRTVDVPPGALLVLYTDGLIESTRDVLEGERRLHAALAKPAVAGARNVARALHDDVLFDGSHDDVAVLALRAPDGGDAAALRRWTFASSDGERAAAARHAFAAMLRERGISHERRFVAEVVFGELIGNVARYAAGPVDVAIDVSGPAPVLHVLDSGPGFRFTPRLPDDVLSERGRGLYIVNSLAAELSVVARPGGGSHARAVLAVDAAHVRRGG